MRTSPCLTGNAHPVCSPGQPYRYKGKQGEQTRIRVRMAEKRVFAACWFFGMMRSTAAERRAVLMDYGPGDSEKYHRRLRKQRGYQRTHRAIHAEEGIPERDDVAKVVLAGVLDRCVRYPVTIDEFVEITAGRLTREKKPFDKDRSVEVLRKMVERHKEGMEREARRRRAADRRRDT